jgi:hypothetical protein
MTLTVESSVFVSEFVVIKNVIETWRGLGYKLRMMGVALSVPIYVYWDNMSVYHNIQRHESVLKKKSNSICYHVVCESSAMGESLIGHVPSDDNPADICTKFVPGGHKGNHLFHLLLHNLCDLTVFLSDYPPLWRGFLVLGVSVLHGQLNT